jgi:hypothetical protein
MRPTTTVFASESGSCAKSIQTSIIKPPLEARDLLWRAIVEAIGTKIINARMGTYGNRFIKTA